MELTLLMEHWLNKDEFTEEELKVFDRFVPYYIFTFTETVKQTDGMGMKLIKIHLLHHFSTMIWLFGHAKILILLFLKRIISPKVKEHARRTRHQSIDFEYRTARKDYEDCVLHAAEKEVIAMEPDTMIAEFIGIHKDDDRNQIELMEKMRNGVQCYADFDNSNVFMAKNPKRPTNWISNFFAKTDFIPFLKDNDIDLVYAMTQHNCMLDQEIIKIHGDPTINHHDWVIGMHMNQ